MLTLGYLCLSDCNVLLMALKTVLPLHLQALSQELNRAQASIIKLETAQAAVATHQKEADILKLQEQVQVRLR